MKSETTKLPVIGLVMKSLEAEFFQAMKRGADEHVAQRGDLKLVTVGTDNQTEIDLQISLINELIDQKVDALVVIPIDSKALVPVVVKAVKSGIPVINIDILLDQEMLVAEGVELGFVGPDNESAAKMVGDVLARKIGKGGKVVILEGVPGAANAIQRKSGFVKTIEEFGLELLYSATACWETGKAEQVFAEMLEQHPDVQGVLCSNDAMAQGVIRVLDFYGKAGSVQVVGFDNDYSVGELLHNGHLLATIDGFGSQMAARGIDYAMKALSGEKITGWIKTDVRLITV